ncbi:hypothetical protein E6O75_ATG04900 [Venturia nashicola]|uniref:Luciferase domain-containing protein n=1 Tax=Venturia nashicola TaxID=86259 RepID=A0A4Z1PF16_9PEZI|nr:hypothetical protein E6O75_ATG04900 [Venturia nashicola]
MEHIHLHAEASSQHHASPLISPWVSIILCLSLTIFTHIIRSDYDAFCALGPGGTPSTFPGYLRIKFLGLFALRNPYIPPAIPSAINRTPYLTKLPRRAGARPIVRGIAPHRQIDQKISSRLFEELLARISQLGVTHKGLRNGTSCLEKHGPGLFAQTPVNRTRHCYDEIMHAHPSDGSMHLCIHPADAALVLSQAWGERHPLSKGGWLERFVPPGFVMVYAPRNEEEVEIIMRIVKAACWWVGNVDVDGLGEAEGRLQTIKDGEELVTGSGCQMPGLVRGVPSGL